MKDYLRELPEPLFTNALYQMLLDALSVRLPSDPDGSAKLMLSILECLPKANQVRLESFTVVACHKFNLHCHHVPDTELTFSLVGQGSYRCLKSLKVLENENSKIKDLKVLEFQLRCLKTLENYFFI